jgi:hypothetical protein
LPQCVVLAIFELENQRIRGGYATHGKYNVAGVESWRDAARSRRARVSHRFGRRQRFSTSCAKARPADMPIGADPDDWPACLIDRRRQRLCRFRQAAAALGVGFRRVNYSAADA